MIWRISLLILGLTVSSAAQATPLTPEAFDRYTAGRTLTFALKNGTVYGAEQYLPNRRVLWSVEGQACLAGRWYGDQDSICFLYDGDPDPKCWRFTKTEDGLSGQYMSDPENTQVYEVRRTQEPLTCPAPWLGS